MSQLQVAKQVFHFTCGGTPCPWWIDRKCASTGSSLHGQRTVHDQECLRSLTTAKVSEEVQT